MRTDSHRLVATLVALGFLAGWFTASSVSPPTAATQVRPARATVQTPEVPMPHIALDAVTAPETTPSSARNPFVFTDRPLSARAALAPVAAGAPLIAPAVDSATGATAPAMAEDASPQIWRVVGIAATADGHVTAVVAGAGDVFLLGMGDRLPDGATVVEIDATGVVVATSAGERVSLRLP